MSEYIYICIYKSMSEYKYVYISTHTHTYIYTIDESMVWSTDTCMSPRIETPTAKQRGLNIVSHTNISSQNAN